MKNHDYSRPLMILVLLASLSIIFLGNCASEYHFIEPSSIAYYHQPQRVDSTLVTITYRYNILRDYRNFKLAENEKQYQISLLALLIDNPSQDTLSFPDDIIISSDGDELTPFKLNKAIKFLATNSSSSSSSEPIGVDIEGKKGTWHLDTGIFTSLIEPNPNKDFKKEMKEYYLLNSIILPGTKVSGLLVLPTKTNSPLTFHLRE